VELLGYKAHMQTRKDMNLHLIGLLNLTPPNVKRFLRYPISARPEEGDLAGIKSRGLISQSHPGKYTLVVLPKSFTLWNRAAEPGKSDALFFGFVYKLNLFSTRHP